MQIFALLGCALAIHPVIAVPKVHWLVPNGPIASPWGRGRSRVPWALVVLEPAFSAMLTFTCLSILSAGSVSRPAGDCLLGDLGDGVRLSL